MPLWELVAFCLALLTPFWIEASLPEAWRPSFTDWSLPVFLACIFFVLGAIPVPWVRRQVPLSIAAFVVPLSMLGWITWRIEYFLMFEHSGAWENLPRVIFSPENLGVALALSISASLGWRLTKARDTRTHNRAA